ncbi:MAG: FctA domain-containing protein, partial [Coriobacteriia bacterium]|nr:FctA domain-containing protein [Coriobacteriia bacterium]
TATASSTADNPLTFTNTYSVEPTTASFPVEKVLDVPSSLDGPDEWSYDITVEAQDGAPTVETMTATLTQDNTSAEFGEFTYEVPGTYEYVVSEDGNVAGVANDEEASGKTVTVSVEDNGDGTMTATVSPTAGITFTNTYSVEPTTASFPVKKVMDVPTGLDGPDSWSYDIAVVANGGAPEAETMSGTVTDAADTITFGDFTYTEPGTYTYTVSEDGTVDGVTNDEDASGKTVTVSVEDDKQGGLTATVKPAAGITFTNTYGVEPTEETPEASKTVSVFPLAYLFDEEAGTGQFEFQVKDGDEVVAKGYNNDKGVVAFTPALKFEMPGTYEYTIVEVDDGQGGITYDKTVVKLVVTVTDDHKGNLVAELKYDGETTPPTFENQYEATGDVTITTGKKLVSTVTGNQLEIDEGDFTFELSALTDDAPLPESHTATNDSAGRVIFDKIEYSASEIDELFGEDAWTYKNKKDEESSSESSGGDEGAADENAATEPANEEGQAGGQSADGEATQQSGGEPADEA